MIDLSDWLLDIQRRNHFGASEGTLFSVDDDADPGDLADDEAVLHRVSGGTSRLAVGVGYGTGDPHFYVWLDENDGERMWWTDADGAERLGRLLVDFAAKCRGQ